MLNEHQISFLPERICYRLSSINEEYLNEIGEVLKKIGELRPKDVHQLQQMYNYGADMDRVINKLSQESGKNVREIYDIFDIVAKENYNYSKPFYEAQGLKFIPYEENKDLNGYVKSLAKQTVDEYANLTQHTAFAVFDKDGKSIAPLFAANKDKIATSLSDTYNRLVDYAVTKVQLGEESYQKAIKDICKAMVNSGIKTVDYASGYSRRLDSSVRQNVLWGVKQCNQESADRIGDEFGADGYEIDYHSNPRPSHADMGGRQYAIGKARTVNGIYYPSFEEEAKPLLEEFGCLHFKFSIILGVSRPAYSERELEEIKREDNKTFEFEGKKYTKHEASQLQNALERKMVAQKELANMAKAAGQDDLRREAQYNLNLLTSKYAKFSKASGLPTRAERLKASGFRAVKADRTPTGIAKYKAIENVKTDKVQYDKYIGILGKENMPETFDLFQKMKYNNIDEWEDIKYYARNINGRPIEYVKIDRELEKLGITDKGRAFPIEDIEVKGWRGHAINRIKKSGITEEQALQFKDYAVGMMKRYPQPHTLFNYYSTDGVLGVKELDGIVQT
ncbi:MAG: phage minor capsid protein, partial [Monoglobales bacterium]